MFESLEIGAGLQIIEWFQSWSQGFIWYLLAPFHYFGEETGYILVLPAIYWSVHKKIGKKILILVLSTAFVNTIFKFFWHRPRPFQVAPERIKAIYQTESYGLPSGHTMFGTVLGISIIKEAKKKWVTLVMILFIMLMGVSRMVHGVHYPQDVAVGLILGIISAFLFYGLYEKISVKLAGYSMSKQFLFIILGLVVVFITVVLVSHEYETRKSYLLLAGALAGGLAGFILESKYVNFEVSGSIVIRILRSVTGLVSLLLFYFLLNFGFYAVIGESTAISVLILYIIRYGLVGFWIAFCAPWLFKKLRLVDYT